MSIRPGKVLPFKGGGMNRNELIERVRQTIREHRMLASGDSVLAAVSGGADSVVMLHALVALKDELSLDITVFHLNHNLRGAESAGDLAFVRRLSKRLSLPFVGVRLKAGELGAGSGSVQEAAREARYRHMLKAAEEAGAKRISLGHSLDDQAETVLLRLVKGGGSAGLAGIPPVRGPFVRPLIDVSRNDIEEYAREGKIKFRTDSSNLTPKYLRNDIRLNLIPYLKARFNPNITASLVRLSAILRADADFIDREAKAAIDRVIVEKSSSSVTLDRKAFAALHAALKARVLMKAIWFLTGESDIYSAHIISSINIIEGRKPNASVNLPEGIVVRRAYDRVVIGRVEPEADHTGEAFRAVLKVPGTTRLAGASFKASISKIVPSSFDADADTAFFDADSFLKGGPYHIRPMASGDRMVPFGMKGRKKLKEIFIDNKVELQARRALPLLCCADEVIWAPGVRRSGRHLVGPKTKKVVKIAFKKG